MTNSPRCDRARRSGLDQPPGLGRLHFLPNGDGDRLSSCFLQRYLPLLMWKSLFSNLNPKVETMRLSSVLNRMHRLNANTRSRKRVPFSMARIAHRPLLFFALVAGVTCTLPINSQGGHDQNLTFGRTNSATLEYGFQSEHKCN